MGCTGVVLLSPRMLPSPIDTLVTSPSHSRCPPVSYVHYMYCAIYNTKFSQMVPNIVSQSPQLLTSNSLVRFTHTCSARPYWSLSSSFSLWSDIPPNPMSTRASPVRANASTQFSQKLVSSHPYHHAHQQRDIQLSGSTLHLLPPFSRVAKQVLCVDTAIVVARTSTTSQGQTSRKSWRIYGRVQRRQ
jgi:hypothetical protein